MMGTMMGIGFGQSNGSTLVTKADLDTLVRQGKLGATINSGANTVVYRGASVSLVALASPHGKPNMTWEIDGLVNPTIVVHRGARITIRLVNTDWGFMHGFELTTTPPPYPFMAMMGIATGLTLMPLPERTTRSLATARYYTDTATLTLGVGTYYYLCQVPGHAHQGMYGRLVVQ